MPAVSVLLPARNARPRLLIAAVESILRQTLRELELIIIDDGGNEASLPRLPADPRIRLFTNPRAGLVNALNFGARLARSPLLARMDGDDIALPERLERQQALLQSCPHIGICGTQVDIFTARGQPDAGYRCYQNWINALVTPAQIARDIFIESPLPHPSAMFRRDVFEQLGGYRDRGWPEDYDLWLRAYSSGVRMAKPEGILLRWRDWPERTSRTDPRYSPQRFTRAKAYFLHRTLLQNRPGIIWGAAPTGALLHDCLLEQGVSIKAFIDIDPKKIGGRKRGKPVLAPPAIPYLSDQSMILVAVGARGARAQIRAALTALGKTEGRDYCVTA